ncbi:MAG TPA: hypothetical protein VGN93_13200 [Shinella sp.]|jgi:hypothetical protein|uniref:hypothetical protein n=1 Tax=Shinella sp. TaxID=1870904 RepID=UPI002E0F60DE|nr:hypothetical protein [Shinella sp.]
METTRRHFLRGAAAASALASAPLATASTAPVENPDLIALGDEFDAAYARLVEASARVDELTPVFRAIAPPIPIEISGEEHQPFGGWRYADFYRDPASTKFKDMKGPTGRRVMVIPSYRLDQIFKDEEMPESIRKMHTIALDFEAGTEAALQTTGLASAIDGYHNAECRLRRLVSEMANVRARTPAGLAIKIRATGVYAGLGAEERFSAGQWLANAMWADLEEGA